MFRFILGIVFGVLVIIFVTQNTAQTEITFLVWTISFSRAVIYIIIFALGFGMGWLIKTMKRRK